ncbi:MAG: 30S ribosomal protein S8 [Fibrobacter sp.]|nr:30S ribosomal protein S8 [Fibrobacter sp.]
MLTDQIADMFNRIRNAAQAKKRTVDIPGSNLKREITRILYENHFISKYAFVDDGKQGTIKVLLKYNEDQKNAIQGLKRVSTPGRKFYKGTKKIPKVLNGMGIAIVTTSKGVMTDYECRKMNVGGEVIGMVW